MAPHWLQKRPKSSAWNTSPSIIWFPLNTQVSLTKQIASRCPSNSGCFLSQSFSHLLALLWEALPPLLVHSVLSTCWLRLWKLFQSLLQDKWPIPPSNVALYPHLETSCWNWPMTSHKTALPPALPTAYSRHTVLLFVPQKPPLSLAPSQIFSFR